MKYLRLKKNNQFQRLFKKGKRVFCNNLTLLYTPSDKLIMGIALSKKHGNAVTRNRIKRLLRAAFTNNLDKLSCNIALVILPKVADSYNYKDFEKSLISCFKRIEKDFK
jgi:ribonuclease P protein component